jgi:hypothetical protein
MKAAISSSVEAVAHPLLVDATLTRQPAGGALHDEDRTADLTTGGPRDNWFARIGAHAAVLESEEDCLRGQAAEAEAGALRRRGGTAVPAERRRVVVPCR